MDVLEVVTSLFSVGFNGYLIHPALNFSPHAITANYAHLLAHLYISGLTVSRVPDPTFSGKVIMGITSFFVQKILLERFFEPGSSSKMLHLQIPFFWRRWISCSVLVRCRSIKQHVGA